MLRVRCCRWCKKRSFGLPERVWPQKSPVQSKAQLVTSWKIVYDLALSLSFSFSKVRLELTWELLWGIHLMRCMHGVYFWRTTSTFGTRIFPRRDLEALLIAPWGSNHQMLQPESDACDPPFQVRAWTRCIPIGNSVRASVSLAPAFPWNPCQSRQSYIPHLPQIGELKMTCRLLTFRNMLTGICICNCNANEPYKRNKGQVSAQTVEEKMHNS